MDFKVPQSIPQDLLLIAGFVDQPQPSVNTVQKPVKDDDDNDDNSSVASSSDAASEEEIASSLLPASASTPPLLPGQPPAPDDSSSSDDEDSDTTSSEDSDSDDEPDKKEDAIDAGDDDDDPVPTPSSNSYFQTRHEVAESEVAVVVPEVETVGEDEVLEKVGRILNVMGNVVIIHGVPSSDLSRGSEKALDSDTLLVFEDRKVLGYIYETFGPTSQPLYQVKFNSTFPLNPEIVIPGRDVFHVPARSKFVFVNQIKAFKGSDASNVHDEEVGEDEAEFSDDEQEAEYKSRMKKKRAESRSRSQAPGSRQATPNPTLMRDQELNGAGIADEILSRNAYAEHGPYDIDYTTPGPSSAGGRPLPGPYDDPYGDTYMSGNARNMAVDSSSQPGGMTGGEQYGRQRQGQQGQRGGGRDRGRGRGKDRERHHPHGAHGQGQTHRGRGRGGAHMQQQRTGYDDAHSASSQNQGGTGYGQQYQQMAQGGYGAGAPPYAGGAWGYNQYPAQGYDYSTGYIPQTHGQAPQGQYPFAPMPMQNPMGMGMGYPPGMGGMGMQGFSVQPHINPRFAGTFGAMGYPGAAGPSDAMDTSGSPMPSQVPTPVQRQLQPLHPFQEQHQRPVTLPELSQDVLQTLLAQNQSQPRHQPQNQNQQQLSIDVDSLLKSVAAASAAAAASQQTGSGSGGQT